MISPWPSTGPILVPESLIFALMIAGNLYVLRRIFPPAGRPPTLADLTFVLGLLLMALGLWGSLVYAAVDPGQASEVSVFIAANSMMAVVGCWMVAVFLRAETKHPAPSGWGWPIVIAGLLVGNEFLMGAAYLIFGGGPGQFEGAGWNGLALAVGASASSAWFYLAMLVNMLAYAVLLAEDARTRRLLVAFALSAAVGPWLVSDPPVGGLAMGLLMAYAVAEILRAGRRRPLSVAYLRIVLLVWVGFGLMTIGEILYILGPTPAYGVLALGLAGVSAMALEILVLTRAGLRRALEPAPIGPARTAPKAAGAEGAGARASPASSTGGP